MRLNPFRSRAPEINPWNIEDIGDAPPIGIHPLLDLQGMQHEIVRTLWEVCRTHERYGRTILIQSGAIFVISLVNVYWAGRVMGWW